MEFSVGIGAFEAAAGTKSGRADGVVVATAAFEMVVARSKAFASRS
jgi:hypothetical protein